MGKVHLAESKTPRLVRTFCGRIGKAGKNGSYVTTHSTFGSGTKIVPFRVADEAANTTCKLCLKKRQYDMFPPTDSDYGPDP
jgi:hypothetical protein